jgi:hypothetical protein
MSAPNICRIENSPAQNITLETLVKIARALGRGIDVTFRARRLASPPKRAAAFGKQVRG